MLGHCQVASLAWDYSYIVVQSNLFVGPMLKLISCEKIAHGIFVSSVIIYGYYRAREKL